VAHIELPVTATARQTVFVAEGPIAVGSPRC
jgi:hypothetical protein